MSDQIMEDFTENKHVWKILKSGIDYQTHSSHVIVFDAIVDEEVKKNYDPNNDILFKALLGLFKINKNILTFATKVEHCNTTSIMYVKNYDSIKLLMTNKLCRSSIVSCLKYYNYYNMEVLKLPGKEVVDVIKSNDNSLMKIYDNISDNGVKKCNNSNIEKIDYSKRIKNLKRKQLLKV